MCVRICVCLMCVCVRVRVCVCVLSVVDNYHYNHPQLMEAQCGFQDQGAVHWNMVLCENCRRNVSGF